VKLTNVIAPGLLQLWLGSAVLVTGEAQGKLPVTRTINFLLLPVLNPVIGSQKRKARAAVIVRSTISRLKIMENVEKHGAGGGQGPSSALVF